MAESPSDGVESVVWKISSSSSLSAPSAEREEGEESVAPAYMRETGASGRENMQEC